MAQRTLEDIFSLENQNSVARKPFTQEIDLREYSFSWFAHDDTYTSITFQIGENEELLTKYDEITKICGEAQETGKQEKFYTAVIEAFRNAHQHGNKKDPNKKITISYRPIQNGFEVVVSDQGGMLNPHFPPFVLLHRQGIEKPCIFYQFAPGTPQDAANSGIGTYIMHTVCDEVNYFTNNAGGLSVQLIVRKQEKR